MLLLKRLISAATLQVVSAPMAVAQREMLPLGLLAQLLAAPLSATWAMTRLAQR
jgi:hypothetical protein